MKLCNLKLFLFYLSVCDEMKEILTKYSTETFFWNFHGGNY
jgi:hypothetical protein